MYSIRYGWFFLLGSIESDHYLIYKNRFKKLAPVAVDSLHAKRPPRGAS
jgi:hypothetical protein